MASDEDELSVSLTAEQRYAAAALFSLALYRSQDVAWHATMEHINNNIWGIPAHIDADLFDDEEAAHLQLTREEWELFWGWDLIAPGGLLDHVYAHMGLSEGVCLGLKRLVKQCTPHTDGEGGVQRPFVSYELITAFASMLGADQLYDAEAEKADGQGAEAHDASTHTANPSAPVTDTVGAIQHQHTTPTTTRNASTHPGPPDAGNAEEGASSEADDLSAALDSQVLDSQVRQRSSRKAPGEGEGMPESPPEPPEGAPVPPWVGAGSVAHAALSAVVRAVISREQMPMSDVILKGKSPKDAKHFSYLQWTEHEGAFHLQPRVHWYDARARTALKEMATWLRLDWAALHGLENVFAEATWAPQERDAQQKKRNKTFKYAAAGAAAVTGGALLAVTGGLAAPIVAGALVAPLLTAAGAAGLGASLAAFVGTTAGTAVVMTSLGAAGAGYAGTRVLRRLGDVKEFGFREIPEDEYAASDGPLLTPPTSSNDLVALSTVPPPKGGPGSTLALKLSRMVSGRAAPRAPSVAGAPQVAAEGLQEEGDGRWLQHGAPEDVADPPTSNVALVVHDAHTVQEAHEASCEAHEKGGFSGGVDAWGRPAKAVSAQDGVTARIAGNSKGGGCSRGADSNAAAAAVMAMDVKSLVELGDGTPSAQSDADTSQPTASKGRFTWRRKTTTPREVPLLPVPLTLSPCAPPRLAVSIGIHGWVRHSQEFITLWGGLQPGDSQRFSLVWESAELIRLSTEMRDMLASIAGQQAARWAATTFVASATVALSALFLPTLVVSAFGSVDGIWAVVLDRAQKSGVLLAHVLMSCCHGGRPVTLVGYSMGARLVYYCLQELAAYSALGIVEHAVLLGAPVDKDRTAWATARRVVSGRLVNGYSRADYVLGVLYRLRGFLATPAGLVAVPCPGVENINFSDIIQGHLDYIARMDDILDMLGLHGGP